MARLEPEALRRLTKHSFERFCRRLLDVEYGKRFAAGTVEIDGPAEEDVADGGRDLRAIVHEAPRTIEHWTLLPDKPADVWYSCKTHKDDGRGTKDPGGWRKQVSDDLDPSPRVIAWQSGKLTDEAEQTAKGKSPPPAELLQALCEGGQYQVLINVSAERRIEFQRGLRALFEFWIRRGGAAEFRLADDAVRVRDATDLANVYNERPFALSEQLARELSVDEPDFLLSWERWENRYSRDRRGLQWRPDDQRDAFATSLQEFLHPSGKQRVFRLWGPPGVGKTRLIYQVLEQARVTERVWFCEQLPELRRWLATSRQPMANDAILVVDEVPVYEAASLNVAFQDHAPNTAKMIMIGPQDLGHHGAPTPVLLERLDDAQTRAILVDQMQNDPRVDDVLGLCRGYPLFAHWLGQALAADPELLKNPGAALTNDEDPWDATCAVLVGPRGGDEATWRVTATARAKALLLTSMTHEQAWDRLSDAERERLAAALRSSWAELEQAAQDCMNRSLLRVHGDRRYVSPANLERLVLNHFFSDKGPGGPPLDPRRLARELPDCFARLSERAQQVHASDSCKRNLAGAALAELEQATRGGDEPALQRLSGMLEPATRLLPELAIATIEIIVGNLGVVRVVNELRSEVQWSLRHIALRRVPLSVFARVEAVSFRLADAAPNPYTRELRVAWAELFRPVVHLTRQPFAVRFELLQARLHSVVERERELAVEALCVVAADPRTALGWFAGDIIDGPWEFEQPAKPDYRSRFEQVWSALLDASADTNSSICARARRAIADNFAAGLEAGLSEAALERLATLVQAWTAEQREGLAARIDDVVRRTSQALGQAFDQLRAAVQPASLQARVIAQVSRLHPGPWPLGVESRVALERAADAELARELIAAPETVSELLPWLASSKVLRLRSFARALGHEDATQSLLPTLCVHAGEPREHRVVAIYLEGWHMRVGDELFDAWLADARARVPDRVLAAALGLIPANDARASVLLQLLQEPTLPREAGADFGLLHGWADELSVPMLDRLLMFVARHEDRTRNGIGLLAVRVEHDVELNPEVRTVAHGLLEQVGEAPPAIVEHFWARAIVGLARRGDMHPLRVALKQALDPQRFVYPHHVVAALAGMVRAGLADQAWRALLDNLSPSMEEQALSMVERASLAAAVSPDLLLESGPFGEQLAASMMRSAVGS